MEQWRGKVAIVTGASAGIGAATCVALANEGVIVVGLARRYVRLAKLKEQIVLRKPDAKFHALKCDLTDEEDIEAAFKYVKEQFGGVDILINNAGIAKTTGILDGNNAKDLHDVLQTNLVSVVSCTQKAYKLMAARDSAGYIVNVSSVLGHSVFSLGQKPTLNLYPSTKFGLRALIQVLQQELNYMAKRNIRISNISPGIVKTEIGKASGLSAEVLQMYNAIPHLEADDVADAIVYLLSTPAHVNIQDIIIRPTGEAF